MQKILRDLKNCEFIWYFRMVAILQRKEDRVERLQKKIKKLSVRKNAKKRITNKRDARDKKESKRKKESEKKREWE